MEEKALEERKEERFRAMIDLVYLINVALLYISSLTYPFVGIVLGIILRTASITSKVKRIGTIALILGIINIAVIILILIILAIAGITLGRTAMTD